MEKIPVRHFTPPKKESDFFGEFTIRDLATMLSGNDMVQELHRHSFFYVLVLERGVGQHIIDFIPYSISNYSIFFMRPGQVHQLTLKHGSCGYLMQFSNDFYPLPDQSTNQILRNIQNFCLLDADRFKNLYFILTYIFQEYSKQQEKYQQVIKSGLTIFFIELLRQSRNTQRLSADTSEYMQERLNELLRLIELHVITHKQVAYYAEEMHLTNYQLNAVTKATLGKTCSEVINDYILLEAKRFLLATANQINQIAWHLGYDDVSYFIRFFKKHTGYSPEYFRHYFK